MNEIETIFCSLLKCSRSHLYLNEKMPLLGPRRLNRLEGILKKRLNGQPLQYLLGETDFFGLTLKVKRGVLIPRPETEILVQEVLSATESLQGGLHIKILDIGTGSGNIAIALAKFLDPVRIHAVDISPACISLARANARALNVSKKIIFRQGDLFTCFKKRSVCFDMIVSNPPYVAQQEYNDLPQDVQQEPRLALVAKDNGLYFYRQIEQGARQYLKSQGQLFLEIGDEQAPGVKNIFKDSSVWKNIRIVRDLCGRDRVIVVTKKG